MRYFIRLGYRGADFHGWQVQPHDTSVQQTVEEAMATLLRVPTPVTGAGRTDAGVNAHLMVAHFDTEQPIVDVNRLAFVGREMINTRIAGYLVAGNSDFSHVV